MQPISTVFLENFNPSFEQLYSPLIPARILRLMELYIGQYIGQTTRFLDERVREHIGYIRNLHTTHTNQPTGEHFNLPGHELHELYYLKVSILQKVYNLNSLFLIFMTETISRNNNFF